MLKLVSTFFKSVVISLFFPFSLYASIIESTIGTAVVNDATATYYNPAALTLLKSNQFVTIGSVANFSSHFTGQTTQTATGYTQSGSARASTNYYLPSFYLGLPNEKFTAGIAVIYNNFARDIPTNSILRYVQSDSHIDDINFVPAIGIKLNKYIAIGAGLNLTHVNFLVQPTSGFPSAGIPDAKTDNNTSATSWGGHAGLLLTPSPSTLIGFNYRSAIAYQMDGSSTYNGNPQIASNQYHFQFWTPARSTLSINHFVTPKLGFMGTAQYIQWNIFKKSTTNNIATRLVAAPVVIPNTNVNFNSRNTWLFTVGSHYRVIPQWILRVAGTYNQSRANGRYQLGEGDSFILAASSGYNFTKHVTVDLGYAHAFIQNQTVNIITLRNQTNGINLSYRNAFSAKLTLNA